MGSHAQAQNWKQIKAMLGTAYMIIELDFKRPDKYHASAITFGAEGKSTKLSQS
jgi:hypothetical protein